MKKKARWRNLTIRISDNDYKALAERAEEAGMTSSEYLRLLIRRARIKVEVEVHE